MFLGAVLLMELLVGKITLLMVVVGMLSLIIWIPLTVTVDSSFLYLHSWREGQSSFSSLGSLSSPSTPSFEDPQFLKMLSDEYLIYKRQTKKHDPTAFGMGGLHLILMIAGRFYSLLDPIIASVSELQAGVYYCFSKLNCEHQISIKMKKSLDTCFRCDNSRQNLNFIS